MSTVSKVCVLCNQDCSARPRVKDAQGRYACQACVDARGAASSPPRHEPPEPAPAEDALPAILFEGAGPALCASCGGSLPAGAVLCTSCGFDQRSGVKLSTASGVESDEPSKVAVIKDGRCGACGYNLAKLKTARCPECGAVNRPAGKAEKLAEESRRTTRMAYIRPAVMLAVGVIGMLVFYVAQGEAMGVVGMLLGLLLNVVVGVGAFWFLCLVWLGFDAPMHLTALRLAGIFALTDLVTAVVGLTGLPLMAWVAACLTYFGLLIKELDLESWRDAWLLSMLMKIISMAGVLGIALALKN